MSDAPRAYTLAEAAAELGWPAPAFCALLCRLYWLRRSEIAIGRHAARAYYVPTAPALHRGDLDVHPAVFRADGRLHHYPRTLVTRRGLARLRTNLTVTAGSTTPDTRPAP